MFSCSFALGCLDMTLGVLSLPLICLFFIHSFPHSRFLAVQTDETLKATCQKYFKVLFSVVLRIRGDNAHGHTQRDGEGWEKELKCHQNGIRLSTVWCFSRVSVYSHHHIPLEQIGLKFRPTTVLVLQKSKMFLFRTHTSGFGNEYSVYVHIRSGVFEFAITTYTTCTSIWMWEWLVAV